MWREESIREDLNMRFLLYTAVFFPMTAAIVCYLAGRKSKRIRDYFADAVTGVEFGLFLFLFLHYIMKGSEQTV